MNGYLRLTNAVYWLALTSWISALAAGMISATAALSILPDLKVTISGLPSAGADEHGFIVAGKLVEPVLTFTDLMQTAAAAIVIIALLLQLLVFRTPVRSIAGLLRAGCLIFALALFGIRMVAATPGMNHHLRGYWQAVQTSDAAAAEQCRQAFDVAYGTVSWLGGLNLILLVIAVLVSHSALVGPAPTGTTELEPPALSRRPTRL